MKPSTYSATSSDSSRTSGVNGSIDMPSAGTALGAIDRVRLEESGIRAAAAKHTKVIALATGDLRIKHAIESGREVVARADIVNDFFVIAHPVEIAPHLAAMHSLRALLGGQCAHCLNRRDGHADVRVVFVGRIVRVDHSRPGSAQLLDQSIAQRRALRILDRRAREIQLHHRAKLADPRRKLLLLTPDILHLRIGEALIRSGARTARTIRASHAAKPLALVLITRKDAVKGHELEVVLMRADAEMRDP